ncbi:MAG: aldolase [Armatimonadetes bacterium]|nr:aldolase [Armatimonadota bacterium]
MSVLPNGVKTLLQQGQLAIGQWLTLPSPAITELLASYGMDWLLVDTEHGPAGWETVEDMIRAMKGTEVVPLVRVAGNDPVLIKKALDRGAFGVVVPLVNTAEQAKAAAAACRYPPNGIRGVAGGRANRYGVDLVKYVAEWNQRVLVICQLETREAVQNAESIATVPGIDVLFIGPNDLSANLDRFRKFEDPEFTHAVDRILQAARAHRKAAGIMAAGADDTLARVDQGFRFISVGSDTRMLGAAAASTYEKIRKGLSERNIPTAGR